MTESSDNFPLRRIFLVACSMAKGAATGWTGRNVGDGDDGGCRTAVAAEGLFWVATSELESGACERCSPLESGGTTAGGDEAGGWGTAPVCAGLLWLAASHGD